MADLPVAARIGTELAKSLASPSLGWLVCPGLMKRALRNRNIAEAEVATEVATSQAERGSDRNLLQNFEGILPEMSTRAERAISSFLADIELVQYNREAVAYLAAAELLASGHSLPDANPLDEDFMTRFYRYAADISKEETQKIWGKLLAGEIHKPGSFSLRTLDILRNMTHEDATSIKLLSESLINNYYLPASFAFWDHPEIKFCRTALVKLSRLGLNQHPDVPAHRGRFFWDLTEPNEEFSCTIGRTFTLKMRGCNKIRLCFHYIAFSPEFHELASLVDPIEPNMHVIITAYEELRRFGGTLSIEPEIEITPNQYASSQIFSQVMGAFDSLRKDMSKKNPTPHNS